MLESIFIIMLIAGIILFLISIETEAYALALMSGVIWLFNLANSLYIEVPVTATTTATFSDLGTNALCLMFAIVSIILAINFWMHSSIQPNG